MIRYTQLKNLCLLSNELRFSYALRKTVCVMSSASSRLPTIRSETLKRTRWWRSISCPKAPPSPPRHRLSRASSPSSTPITGDAVESWRRAVVSAPPESASGPGRGLFKPQNLIEPGVNENGADPGFHVGEPEFEA